MQMALMHESIIDALREAIQAAGGNKPVGALLYPDLPVDQAAGRVRDCLNPDRREHFTPGQVVVIARLAREAGNHALMTYLAGELSYLRPVPVDPEGQLAERQREFVDAVKALHSMANRIELITATANVRRVS
jgi:hypothetical protein